MNKLQELISYTKTEMYNLEILVNPHKPRETAYEWLTNYVRSNHCSRETANQCLKNKVIIYMRMTNDHGGYFYAISSDIEEAAGYILENIKSMQDQEIAF